MLCDCELGVIQQYNIYSKTATFFEKSGGNTYLGLAVALATWYNKDEEVLAMKLTVSKSKNSASFYVQKTIRKPDGKVTTITIEKLGNLTEVTAKACGKDPYVWAQEYVNELNRKEYDENKEILVSYSPSKLLKKGEQKLFNCGYLFLQKIYYQLGLDKICRDISGRHLFEYDLNDILSKLIYTRILFPSSKLSSNKQAKKLIEQPSFELHDIYRSLSVLAEENDFIQAQLYKNSQKVIERRKKTSSIMTARITSSNWKKQMNCADMENPNSTSHSPS